MRRVPIAISAVVVALLCVGSAIFAWDQTPWAHRHDSCGHSLHTVAAPRLIVPVTQGRYSSGPVSSAAQAEDALVPPLHSRPETTRLDAAALQRLLQVVSTIRVPDSYYVRLGRLKATPALLAKSCRD